RHVGDRIVLGKMDDERFRLSRTQPNEVLIEARWIAGGSELHRYILVMIDFAVGIGAIDIKHRRVAVGDRSSLDRFVRRSALAKPFQRLIDGIIGDRGGRLTKSNRREIAR